MRYPFFVPVPLVPNVPLVPAGHVPDVPNVPDVPSAEDGCGGVRFSIDNLQFIPALYKITYNLGLNYKLCRTVKQKIWKIWSWGIHNWLIING
jgi:hypothetical protein